MFEVLIWLHRPLWSWKLKLVEAWQGEVGNGERDLMDGDGLACRPPSLRDVTHTHHPVCVERETSRCSSSSDYPL